MPRGRKKIDDDKKINIKDDTECIHCGKWFNGTKNKCRHCGEINEKDECDNIKFNF